MCTRLATALPIRLAVIGWCAWASMPLAAAPRTTRLPLYASEPPAQVAPSHGESGRGEIGINPLDFKRDLAIWTAVVFLVLLVFLWRVAWRPIGHALQLREQRIADEIAAAKRTNEEARGLLAEYQQRLSESSREVQGMLEAGRRDAEKVGQEIVAKARAEAEAEQRRRLEEIEAAADDAIKGLGEQSATLAVELAGKIVAAKLDAREHSQLIEQALNDFFAEKPKAD